MRRLAVPLVLALASVPAGCNWPGGAPSGAGFEVTAEFSDVLDLVPQSAVKVNDVTVGSVESISLSGWHARVRLSVARSVTLPANATAAVRQTSLLGEKYVALESPVTEAPRGKLANGAVVPLERTSRSAEVEEVLSALGLLLNGGGLAQLKTINDELGDALEGNEKDARDAINQLDVFVGGLDKQKADLVKAIDALDRLSTHLQQQRAVIGKALDSVAPGLTVLEQQRDQLTTALKALGELGKVGTRVVNASADNTVADLKALKPTLEQLAKAGDSLPKSLDMIFTFPFPPNVSGAIIGDYVNLGATADLDPTTILSNLLVTAPGTPAQPPKTQPPAKPDPKKPATPPKNNGGVIPSLPLPCLPVSGVLPPNWQPPEGCDIPPECQLIKPGGNTPPGSIVPPGGIIPPGTIFPPGTVLQPGTALSPACLLPPVTGSTNGRQGGLGGILGGGLLG
jgi:phospholipid/cholesterol/gamma-HCH transport system substrate-binding protein